MHKQKQKFRLPELGNPVRYDFNAKIGKMYVNGQEPNSGIDTMDIRIVLNLQMPNIALYGLNGVVPKRDWRIIVFANQNNCICTAAFHSASDGAFSRYLSLLFAAGKELHEVVTRVLFVNRTYKTGMSGFALSFNISNDESDPELEAWATSEAAPGLPYYHACLPTRHINTMLANNPLGVTTPIVKSWQLTDEQIALLQTANPETGEALLLS